MKLVVDTNLLVSGTLWSGSPARLLNAVLSVPGTLCLSAEMLMELGGVLGRGEFTDRFTKLGVTVSEIMLRYQRLSRRVRPTELSLPLELRDPKDLIILAAAVGAGAEAIVTGDKDLLVLGEFKNIPIIEVREALRRLGLETE